MDSNTPTVLSLCSGAGGLELGLKLAVPRCRTVCYVEGEAYAAAQLAARMEDETMDAAPVWSDVKTFDPEPWRGCVDMLTAGYPCQPFSIAGSKRAEKDPRHLWPYIKDIVGVIEPEICFFENVSHHLRLGFQQVHDDLRSMGYSVAAGLFTAEEVGAPHKRERLFILAYRDRDRCLGEHGTACGENDPQGRSQCAADTMNDRKTQQISLPFLAFRSGHHPQATESNGDMSQMRLNPLFTEWLMGWPFGWTDFGSVETEWCHWWQLMRSEFCLLLSVYERHIAS